MKRNPDEEVRRNGGTDGSRRFRLGVLLSLALGAIMAGAAVVSTQAASWSHVGRGFRGHFGHDPELARERAEFAASWVLSRIDATDEQQERVKAIIGRSADDLAALVEQHRQSREAWVAELSKPTIDRAALEELRRAEMELADAATARVVDALAEAAEALTPEQRAQLIEMAERFHSHR
ncbi:MAG TPA: periplasmic heavy metal sensor [Vicinamibacteria bacterium]|nr:periplasmic heavy metal sensor [Vicinamibacteria bacterium]